MKTKAATSQSLCSSSLLVIHETMQAYEGAQRKLCKVMNDQLVLMLSEESGKVVADLVARVVSTYFTERELTIRSTNIKGKELADALKPMRNTCAYVATLVATQTGYTLVKPRGGDYMAIEVKAKATPQQTAKGVTQSPAAMSATQIAALAKDAAPILKTMSLDELLKAVASRFDSRLDLEKAVAKLPAKLWKAAPSVVAVKQKAVKDIAKLPASTPAERSALALALEAAGVVPVAATQH